MPGTFEVYITAGEYLLLTSVEYNHNASPLTGVGRIGASGFDFYHLTMWEPRDDMLSFQAGKQTLYL